MPTGSSSARVARPSPSIRAASAAARRSTIPGITFPCWRASPERCGRRTLQRLALPGAIERVRRKLAAVEDGDRQMVEILGAVPTDGLAAVEAACAAALAA